MSPTLPSSTGPMPRRESLGRLVNQSTMLLMISIGALILLLAVLILFHENANATKGYSLRKLENQRSVLLLEQEVLNMRIADAQSLEKLQNDAQILQMRPYTKVKYVSPQSIQKASSSASSLTPAPLPLRQERE